MIFIFLLALMSACGEYRRVETYIHPDFVEGVAIFHTELHGRGFYEVQEITYGDLSKFLGFCRVYSDGTRKIVIAEKMKQEDEDFKLDTLFHELIHCALDVKKHSPEDSGSIMEAKGNKFEVEQGGGAIKRLRNYLAKGI